LDSNEIDESDLQTEKYEESRISISDGISTFDEFGKSEINQHFIVNKIFISILN
jgi:hypothetical protein